MGIAVLPWVPRIVVGTASCRRVSLLAWAVIATTVSLSYEKSWVEIPLDSLVALMALVLILMPSFLGRGRADSSGGALLDGLIICLVLLDYLFMDLSVHLFVSQELPLR